MTRTFLTLPALLLIAAACFPKAADPVEPPAEVTDPVVIAVTIAKAIQATPTKADSILHDWSYTAESFEKLLADIAKDSTQSARYTAGMR